MRILFLSQRVPYPPNRGDKITTWRLVERMAREHEVKIIAFAHDEGDLKAAEELRAKGFDTTAIRHHPTMARVRSLPLFATSKPLTLGVYGSRELQAAVDAAAPECDCAYAYSSSMGAFLVEGDLPWVMHFAELDSDKWRQYGEKKSWPASWVYRREWRTLLDFERRVAKSAQQNVFCTPLEEDIFQESIGGRSAVLPNGVDLEYYSPVENAPEPGHLMFTGVMNYYPNVDACLWFANEILPRVREQHPGARFTIVGSQPAPEIEKLGETDGITVTGFVDDTRDWLRRCDVAVAPLRIARGIQNKVLEAMGMGLPVVGTTPATQGVGAQDGRDYLVADEADDITRHVCELLAAPERARELGATGRRYVEDHYDWEVVFEPLDEILAGLTRD